MKKSSSLSVGALLVYLFVPSAALAQSWSPAAPLPVARGALGAAAVGDTIYAVGGNEPTSPFPGWRNEALNTATGVWTAKASLPDARTGAAVVAVGGKVYAFGGHDGSNLHKRVEAYDPTADTWSTATMWETPRVGHTAAVLDGKVYLIGGLDPSGSFPTAVDVYDPASDSWGSAAPIPTILVGAAAAELDGLIYVVGGVDLTPVNRPRVIAYDKATDTWTTRNAQFAEKRAFLAAGVLDGALYAVGGNDEGLAAYTFFTRYDPLADTWIEMPPMSQGRNSHAVAVVGNALYAIGGIQATVGFLASVEVFTVPATSDAAAPQTTAARFPAPNAAGWNNSNVTVTLTAVDNEGGSGVKSITYRVSETGGGFFGATVNDSTAVVVVAAEGTSTVTYFATDNAGNVEAQKALTVRIDRTAPGATLSLSPSVIWPPNNRMVRITPSLSASDSGGLPVTVSSPVVTSNEPAAGDIQVSGGTLQLRAERDGRGSGRVYTVTYTVTDVAGNSTTVSGTVSVPHDRRR